MTFLRFLSRLFTRKRPIVIATYRRKEVDYSINNEIHQQLKRELGR